MIPDLSGKWTGKLTYGKNFGQLEHEALFFTVDIVQQCDEISGIWHDREGVGASPGATAIKGFVDQEHVNFIGCCQVPAMVQPLGYEDRETTAEISFSGTYNSQTQELEGEWILLSGYLLYNHHLFFERDNGGSWSLGRAV